LRDVFRWTDYEDNLLIEAVKEARSVKDGLANAAQILGTTIYVCRNRWYKHIQNKLHEQEEFSPSAAAAEVELVEEESFTHDTAVEDVKSSLEGFLYDLTKLVEENRRLLDENARLKKELKILEEEKKEISEAYDYILRVINRARELCIQDEERPARLRYQVSADGTVKTVST
jgi:regulator of replication initiation timing